MELTIIEKAEQPELKRIIGKASLLFEGAIPSRKDVLKEVAKKTSTEEDLVVIDKISSIFGKTKAIVSFSLYEDKDTKEKILHKHVAKKHVFKEEKKEEEATEENKE
jgi:ribosomal protein S24E